MMSLGKWSIFATIARERSDPRCKKAKNKSIVNKLNQHTWDNIRGI